MIIDGTGPIYLDCETCGFHGMPVIIQYQQGDGTGNETDVTIHSFWKVPVGESLDLVEAIANNPEGIVGFNLVFDVFHLCKIYTTFKLFAEKFGYGEFPEDFIDEIAELEAEARDGPCW